MPFLIRYVWHSLFVPAVHSVFCIKIPAWGEKPYAGTNETGDTRIFSPMLYQLS